MYDYSAEEGITIENENGLIATLNEDIHKFYKENLPDKLKNLVKAEALFRQKNQNELNEKKPNKCCLIVKKEAKSTQKNQIQPETGKKSNA